MQQQPNYSQDLPTKNVPFWVRIDDYDGDTYYAWTQQMSVPGPAFIDAPGGMSGTLTVNPAYEPNGELLTVGKYVQIQREYLDPSYNWVYSASYPASAVTPPDETTTCVCITDVCTGEVRYFNLPADWETTQACSNWYCLEAPMTLDLSCQLVTPAELATLEGEGYTVLSGPHADQETCVASCEGSGSGSGSGSCDMCDTTYCITFTSIVDGVGLSPCMVGTGSGTGPTCSTFNGPMEMTGVCPFWDAPTLPFCYGKGGVGVRTATIHMAFAESLNKSTITIAESSTLVAVAIYECLNWDCTATQTFTLVSNSTECAGWPSFVQVVPGPCGGSGSGSGGPRPDCCFRADPDLPALVGTVTAKVGCFASMPSTLNFADSGTHNFWLATFTPFACDGRDVNTANFYCGSSLAMLITDGTFAITENFADDGATCDPFSAVWHVDDGAGNTCTITIVE